MQSEVRSAGAGSKGSKAEKAEIATSLNPTLANTTLSYPEPCDEMFAYAYSSGGLVELKDIYFRCDDQFQAGNYTVICRDVTKGLPPRNKMRNLKLLLKMVNQDPEVQDETTIKTKETGKKAKK